MILIIAPYWCCLILHVVTFSREYASESGVWFFLYSISNSSYVSVGGGERGLNPLPTFSFPQIPVFFPFSNDWEGRDGGRGERKGNVKGTFPLFVF